MKAIVQERYGSPDGLRLRELEKPAVGDHEVLVRIRAASVNAADWHLLGRIPNYIGVFIARKRPSRRRGADLAGQVDIVGKNVTRFKPGDEVFGAATGAFAEYATAGEDRLAAKPRNLTFERAAAIPVAGCPALQGFRDYAHLQPGQTVLIHGAGGGVGTFAVQIAKALGAHVTAVTGPKNIDVVRALGPDALLDYTKEDVTRRAERYDVVFDVAATRSIGSMRRL